MKTVGVLGGLGPQATMDFESRVHRVAQRLIPQQVNAGYPPMVVYYFRGVPFVADEVGAPAVPLRPHPDFLAAAAGLGQIADFLVITSNFLHVFRADVEAAAGCEVLSMIELTLEEVRRRGWKRVGVVGFGDPLVYTTRLGELGLSTETVRDERRANLDDAIRGVMEGRDGPNSVRAAEEALDEVRSRGVDGTILACTEIPLLLGHPSDASLIDPLPLLAEATVRFALA